MKNVKPVLLLVLIAIFFGAAGICYAQSAQEPASIGKAIDQKFADTSAITKLRTLGESYLDRPGSLKADMEKAMAISGKMEKLSRTLHYEQGVGESRLLLAKAYREMGQSEKGRGLAGEALAIFKKTGPLWLEAEAVIELGGTYSNQERDLPMKISLYEQGLRIYHSLGNRYKEGVLKEFIGDLYHLKQDHATALAYLNGALAIYDSIGFKRLQGAYGIIGEIYNNKGDFLQSLRYNLLAMKTGEELKDTSLLMSTIYNRVGLSYFSINADSTALFYFRKGLHYAHSNTDTGSIQLLLFNISDALRKQGAYRQALDTLMAAAAILPSTDVYDQFQFNLLALNIMMSMKKYRDGEQYFRRVLSIYESDQLSGTLVQVMRVFIAEYLQALGKYKESHPYLLSFFAAQSSNHATLLRTAQAELLSYRADSASDNTSSALIHFKNYKLLSDSLMHIMQSRQLGQLQIQFETEKKDQNIRLLIQKSQLQEASLQKEKVVRNVIISGVFVLLVFFLLMYNRYRLRKQTNIQLEIKQEEINAQNVVLKKLLEDKEWLLKEIHHRVKNNLQIIISLLNTQSRYLDNKDALAAIRNSQHRMYAMSLIHQRLYQTDNPGKINMAWYIRELVGYMQDSFETGRRITFELDIDAVEVDVVQAAPLGLILNEAVSNAIKYAFPDNRKGIIRVSLKHKPDGDSLLSISDNGVGFDEETDITERDSLGMSLMQGLSLQLDGVFSIRNNNPGVIITVHFICRDFTFKTAFTTTNA